MTQTYPARWIPKPHQRRAVKWLVKQTGGLLLLDMGLMKSSIVLRAFTALQQAKVVRKALIVAPKRPCYLVWSHEHGAGELWKWLDFNHLAVELLHGPKKAEALERDADLYVINYDGLRWLHESGGFRELLKRGVDLGVFDEGSKLKHSNTARYKALKPYLPRLKRRWVLTGTPASNTLMDLFGQAYAADLGRTFGRFITHYRYAYFYPSGYGGYTWKLQPGAEKQIYRKLKSISLSMRAKDHLDLPALVEQDLWVDLPPKARKVYDTFEDDLIVKLDDGVLTAANAAVASGKCRQVASGGVYRDTHDIDIEKITRSRKRVVTELHDAKTEALVDLVDELQGSPLLVLFAFHHDLDRIRKAFGKKRVVPSIDGSTSDREATRLVQQWNAGTLPVLCGHPGSMGFGLNLQQVGHHVAWFSLPWDLEHYEQAIRRVHRYGQRHRVVVHRILARSTVDEAIAAALRRKHRGQEKLLDELRGYADKRKSRHHG